MRPAQYAKLMKIADKTVIKDKIEATKLFKPQKRFNFAI